MPDLPTLFVRDIPKGVYKKAQAKAKAADQSLSAYVRALLCRDVEADESNTNKEK